MAQDSSNASYLLNLPMELKIKIFAYLDGSSKVNLLKVCKETFIIAKEPLILQNLEFSKDDFFIYYHLLYLNEKGLCMHVKKLNINYAYWISALNLMSVLRYFTNLTELHIVGTSLLPMEILIVLIKLNKVKRLSISIDERQAHTIKMFPFYMKIKCLYIKCTHVLLLSRYLSVFKDLDELWICENRIDLDENITEQRFHNYEFPEMKKHFILIQHRSPDDYTTIRSPPFQNNNWVKYMHAEHNFRVTVMFNRDYYDKISADNSAFFKRVLKTLCLYDDYRDTDDYDKFKYLNLQFVNFDADVLRNIRCKLFSDSVKQLKSLKCYASLFQEARSVPFIEYQRFKRLKTSDGGSYTNGAINFERFMDFVPNLEELCFFDDYKDNCSGVWTIDTLRYVTKLKNIKTLIITSSNFSVAQFLIDILRECQSLECLKIENRGKNDKIFNSICTGLVLAKHLKDFRYKSNTSLSINHLFRALSKCRNLERVTIDCKNLYNFDPNGLIPLLKGCRKLCFVAIKISTTVVKHAELVQKFFNIYSSPERFSFVLKGDEQVLIGSKFVFHHFEEMMFQNIFPDSAITFAQTNF